MFASLTPQGGRSACRPARRRLTATEPFGFQSGSSKPNKKPLRIFCRRSVPGLFASLTPQGGRSACRPARRRLTATEPFGFQSGSSKPNKNPLRKIRRGFLFGERAGIRTRGHLIKSQVLYRLSYTPLTERQHIDLSV